jgi:hypothetical protein
MTAISVHTKDDRVEGKNEIDTKRLLNVTANLSRDFNKSRRYSEGRIDVNGARCLKA